MVLSGWAKTHFMFMSHCDGEIGACMSVPTSGFYVCVLVCIQTHAQVSETSSVRYLCLSLKAITSLLLLAETTGAGRELPFSQTDLSAWRASRVREERERERENSFEVSSLRRVVISRVCQNTHHQKFHNSNDKGNSNMLDGIKLLISLFSGFPPQAGETHKCLLNTQISCQNVWCQHNQGPPFSHNLFFFKPGTFQSGYKHPFHNRVLKKTA